MKRFSILAVILTVILSLNAFTVYAAIPSALPKPAQSQTPQNIFKFEKDEVPEIYLTNQSSPIYLLIPTSQPAHAEIVKALAATKVVTLSSYDKDSGIDTGFFIISKSGKTAVNLRPGNILEVDGVPYGTTAKQYNRLVELGNGDYDDLIPIAQWCAAMTYQNIVKVEYSASPEDKLREIPAENVRVAAKELHGLTVKGGKVIFPNEVDLENWKGRTKMVYTFENGVQYAVYANSAFLFIECKGMTYTCRYTSDFSAYVARAKELASKTVSAAAPSPTEAKKPATK